jgi:hypothetical protein
MPFMCAPHQSGLHLCKAGLESNDVVLNTTFHNFTRFLLRDVV